MTRTEAARARRRRIPTARPGALRAELGAIALRAGGAWRLPPQDFPPWQTVCRYVRRRDREGASLRLHQAPGRSELERAGRERAGPGGHAIVRRHRQPDGPHGGSKGESRASVPAGRFTGASAFDVAPGPVARPRLIPADRDGRLPEVAVPASDMQEHDGAGCVPEASRARFPLVERVFAGAGHAGRRADRARDRTHRAIELSRRLPFAKGFVVLKRRADRRAKAAPVAG